LEYIHELEVIAERQEERAMPFYELKKASIRVCTICQQPPLEDDKTNITNKTNSTNKTNFPSLFNYS
jgi:hypothetical protein